MHRTFIFTANVFLYNDEISITTILWEIQNPLNKLKS